MIAGETGGIKDKRFLFFQKKEKKKREKKEETRKQKNGHSMSGCHKLCQAAVSVYDCASWNE